MDVLFAWLPMPAGLDEESWLRFLGLFAAVFLVLLIATVTVAVLGYRQSARARRIYRHTDVFSPYTPLKWLWASLGGAFVAAIACAVTYKSVTATYDGMFSTCCEFFLIMLVLALVFSYLAMAVPLFKSTPRKFKYRAAPFLHGTGAKSPR